MIEVWSTYIDLEMQKNSSQNQIEPTQKYQKYQTQPNNIFYLKNSEDHVEDKSDKSLVMVCSVIVSIEPL